MNCNDTRDGSEPSRRAARTVSRHRECNAPLRRAIAPVAAACTESGLHDNQAQRPLVGQAMHRPVAFPVGVHYSLRMKKSVYKAELRRLHGELVTMQEWVKHTGARIVIVFEGRDAAGKGGMIKALTARVSPRVFRVVALPAPSDREKTQLYYQRYIRQFPAGGEVVIFDRSWYNRAGVEPVMGFCTPRQTDKFLKVVPHLEHEIQQDGIILLKYWLEVSNEEQERRFQSRIDDPAKVWKLSSMDLEARRRWYDYSAARDRMLDATDTRRSPWNIVRSDDKEEARLACISHILAQIPYDHVAREHVELPPRDESNAYDDIESMRGRRYVTR